MYLMQINSLASTALNLSFMMGFQQRSKIWIAAAASIIFVQATGLEAQPRPADAQELILRAEPLPPDAQQFMVYQPTYNLLYHQKSAGPRPTFSLHYAHRVTGQAYFGPSYAFSVYVHRELTPKAALESCDWAFNRPRHADTKYQQRLSGYACAFVEESTNVREMKHSRLQWYAKCNYVVTFSEDTQIMPMPAQAPIAPLLKALDQAVAALRLGECTDDIPPQAGPSDVPAKPIQSAAPAKPAPAACSADVVARYLAGLANQPPARRPAPGSVVALIEGGQPCVAEIPAAGSGTAPQNGPAQPPAPGRRIIVIGADGVVRIITSADAAATAAKAPQFVVPGLAGEFQNLATSPLLIGPVQTYADGQLVFPPLPNAPPGYKTRVDRAFDWAEARVAAELNWARENKAQAAIAVLSVAVAMALPELPAVAELGSLGATLVSGLVAPVAATSTTIFINNFMSTGRTDKAAWAVAQEVGLLVLKALPSAFGGELFKTVSTEIGAPALITSLAEKAGSTAGDLGVQYAPSILSQPIPANYQSAISFPPRVPR